MNNRRLLAQRLIALFGAGWLLFDFPLLKIWLAEGSLFGLQLQWMALFGAWALLIAVLAGLMESQASE